MVINLYVRVPLSYMLVTSHLFYSYGEDVLLALTATIRPSALLSDGYITRERGFRQIAPAAVAVKRPDGSGVHISSGSGLGVGQALHLLSVGHFDLAVVCFLVALKAQDAQIARLLVADAGIGQMVDVQLVLAHHASCAAYRASDSRMGMSAS